MKAYYLSIRDDDDQGGQIVFADNATDAKKQIDSNQFVWDNWIDIQAHRWKRFDGKETLSKSELALFQWKDGWRWFDMDYPSPDEASDEEFQNWYLSEFGDDK